MGLISRFVPTVLLVTLALGWGCGGGEEGTRLSGNITIDGSSTVYPITEAMAEEFRRDHPDVRVTIGVSGTGGGFKKLSRGEIDIADASRPIKQSELRAARENRVDFIELPVAYDGIVIVVNPRNSWATGLTVDDLKRLWQPEAQAKVTRWNQIRPNWPNQEIHLFGPGVDSGTYDYFTSAVVGKEGASRGDYTSSEDDNVLVQGVAADEYALGYFGFAYYYENQGQLKAVPIDDGKAENGGQPVSPSVGTVRDGTYQPLSRPIFIYVRKQSSTRPEVKEFVDFYLKNAPALVGEVGYIPLPDRAYTAALERFRQGLSGSVFSGGSQVGVSIEELLRKESGRER